MTSLKIRRIPFEFDGDVPYLWNPDNPEFAVMCNGVGVLAIAFEKFVVASLKQAMPLITDDAVREEADAFMRQEGQHARMHRKHVAALTARYPGVQDVLDEAVASFDELLDTRPIEFNLAYTADLEAMFTPLFKVFLDHHETLYAPGDDRVASLFMWHFVEEVEHRSSALTIYRHVVGSETYRFRMLPRIMRHVRATYAHAVLGFARVIPAEDQWIDSTRALPSRMWRREIGVRLPWVRDRVIQDGHGTALQDATTGELLRMAWGLLRSQTPGHDPEHQPLPRFAVEWHDAYEGGRDVSNWYAAKAAAERAAGGLTRTS